MMKLLVWTSTVLAVIAVGLTGCQRASYEERGVGSRAHSECPLDQIMGLSIGETVDTVTATIPCSPDEYGSGVYILGYWCSKNARAILSFGPDNRLSEVLVIATNDAYPPESELLEYVLTMKAAGPKPDELKVDGLAEPVPRNLAALEVGATRKDVARLFAPQRASSARPEPHLSHRLAPNGYADLRFSAQDELESFRIVWWKP